MNSILILSILIHMNLGRLFICVRQEIWPDHTTHEAGGSTLVVQLLSGSPVSSLLVDFIIIYGDFTFISKIIVILMLPPI